MPGAVHHIEKGMMGWDPNRPTENPSLLLLLAPHSQGPLEIKDHHNKRDSKRETEIGRDGPKKVSRESRKDAMNHRNPCGLLLITETPGLLLSPKNSQRDFLENVCETSTLSQDSLLHPVPYEVSSELNSILTCYIL